MRKALKSAGHFEKQSDYGVMVARSVSDDAEWGSGCLDQAIFALSARVLGRAFCVTQAQLAPQPSGPLEVLRRLAKPALMRARAMPIERTI